MLKKYEITKGTFLIIEATGKRDDSFRGPLASFVRPEYKVVDYGGHNVTWPNDLIYINPSDWDKITDYEQSDTK